MTDKKTNFEQFDTPSHTAAQLRCHHIIHHAIDAKTRRAVGESLDYSRQCDPSGIQLVLLQLTDPCEHRLPALDKIVEAVQDHARLNEAFGWDRISQGWSAAEIDSELRKHTFESVTGAIIVFQAIVDRERGAAS